MTHKQWLVSPKVKHFAFLHNWDYSIIGIIHFQKQSHIWFGISDLETQIRNRFRKIFHDLGDPTFFLKNSDKEFWQKLVMEKDLTSTSLTSKEWFHWKIRWSLEHKLLIILIPKTRSLVNSPNRLLNHLFYRLF